MSTFLNTDHQSFLRVLRSQVLCAPSYRTKLGLFLNIHVVVVLKEFLLLALSALLVVLEPGLGPWLGLRFGKRSFGSHPHPSFFLIFLTTLSKEAHQDLGKLHAGCTWAMLVRRRAGHVSIIIQSHPKATSFTSCV